MFLLLTTFLLTLSKDPMDWKSLFQSAISFSRLAKTLRARGKRKAAQRSFLLKKEILIHAILAISIEFRIATDNKTFLSVGPRSASLHMPRTTTTLFPKYEHSLIQAKVSIAKIISLLLSREDVSDSLFGDSYDRLDELKPFNCRLIEKRIKNAFDFYRIGEPGAAKMELRMALGSLNRIIRHESQRPMSASQKSDLLTALARIREGCQKRFVRLAELKGLWRAIDNTQFTTEQLLGCLKKLQLVAFYTREEKNFERAQILIDEIEAELLGRPPSDGFASACPIIGPTKPRDSTSLRLQIS